HPRYNWQSRSARSTRFRTDNGPAEFSQRRFLRAQHDDSGNGGLLRWYCADNRWHHGMAKRQYLRHDRVHFLRALLALARGVDRDDETWLGREIGRAIDGGVSFPVGIVHPRHVHWHTPPQSRAPIRLPFAYRFIFPVGLRRFRERERRFQTFHRLGRNRLRLLRNLHRPCPGLERTLRQNASPTRPG